MVYDTFMFFNEIDLLELRLEYLSPVVDRFVIVEAEETHAGKRKGYLLESALKNRLKQYEDKIEYIKVAFPVWMKNAMERDRFQRACLTQGIKSIDKDALIFVSDLDEIPMKEIVSHLNTADLYKDNICVCIQDIFYFYINRLDPSRKWAGTAVVRNGLLREYGYSLDDIRCIVRGIPYKEKQFTQQVLTFSPGGWHFSWLGGAEKIKYKLENYAHVEDNTPDRNLDKINNAINNKEDLLREGVVHTTTEITRKNFPALIYDNIDKYKALGWIDESIIADPR